MNRLSYKAAAEAAGVHRSTICRMVKEGRLTDGGMRGVCGTVRCDERWDAYLTWRARTHRTATIAVRATPDLARRLHRTARKLRMSRAEYATRILEAHA